MRLKNKGRDSRDIIKVPLTRFATDTMCGMREEKGHESFLLDSSLVMAKAMVIP